MNVIKMKYSLILLLALEAVSGFSQAVVVFENDENSRIKQPNGLYDPRLHNLFGHVQLAYAPAGTPTRQVPVGDPAPYEYHQWLSNNPGWLFASTTRVQDGLFDGGEVTLEGIAPGAAIQYAIFAWGPNDTVDECYYNIVNGSWGYSGPFTSLTGGGGVDPVSLAASFREMVLIAPGGVPEPSALSLAVLGGLLAFSLRSRSLVRAPDRKHHAPIANEVTLAH